MGLSGTELRSLVTAAPLSTSADPAARSHTFTLRRMCNLGKRKMTVVVAAWQCTQGVTAVTPPYVGAAGNAVISHPSPLTETKRYIKTKSDHNDGSRWLSSQREKYQNLPPGTVYTSTQPRSCPLTNHLISHTHISTTDEIAGGVAGHCGSRQW